MRNGISFTLSSCHRQRLQATVADPKSPRKQVWRARIVLVSGGGLGTSAIMAETGNAPIAPDRVSEIVRLSMRQTDDLVGE